MSVDSIKSQNISQYISLLSNPTFLKAVKSANEGDSSGKFDALLENLEKLSALLSENNESSIAGDGTVKQGINLFSIHRNATKEDEDFWKLNKELGQLVENLMDNADLMQNMLNLDVIPPNDEEISLFSKFLEIIQELDRELKAIEKQAKDKEVKCEYKLRPSSSSKSGFEEVLTFIAK